MEPKNFHQVVMYQIFPLGAFVDEDTKHGILETIDWIPHLEKLGINTVYFAPVFSSSDHGYDTKDYRIIDERLGTNEDFTKVCRALHDHHIKVILDGVFNHVGREFWAFKDVQEKKWDSPYKDWFCVNFDGNSNYDDGFWYEGWEGHYELVKLNLDHPDVRQYLLETVGMWMDEFAIDGVRLDVAYMLNRDFMRDLAGYTKAKNPDFLLAGEMLHGDYKEIVNPQMLGTATNYECYKGLYSSFNTHNMHEIGYSLNRQFGPDEWTLYKGMPLYNFVDNHDVERIATQLENKEHLPLIFTMLFGMPGFPCIYYGSEWGIEGKKEPYNDRSLRPRIKELVENDLTKYIGKLSKIRKEHVGLQEGGYRQLAIAPDVLVFARETDNDCMVVALNIGDQDFEQGIDVPEGKAKDLISGKDLDLSEGLKLLAMTGMLITIK